MHAHNLALLAGHVTNLERQLGFKVTDHEATLALVIAVVLVVAWAVKRLWKLITG